MASLKPIDEWKDILDPALDSKVEEFKLMGYGQATKEAIWACLKDKVWKGSPNKRLHEAVQDIFHLKTSLFMSYLTVSAFTDDTDLMSSIKALTNDE